MATVGRPTRRLALGLGAAALAALLGLALAGELAPFAAAGLNVLPFIGLAVLAALGETRRWARWLAYLYLVALGLGLLGLSALLVFGASLGPRLTEADLVSPDEWLAVLRPGLLYLALGTALLIVALLALAPGVRRWAARWLPLRPGSVTDTVGLGAVLALALLPTGALVVLEGQPPLLTLAGLPSSSAGMGRPLDLIYGLIWLLPASLVLVGYPIRRGLAASLTRLGLVWPSWQQVVLGLGTALGLVLAMTVVLDPGIAWLWDQLGWPRTDAQAVSRLMAGLITPLGALVIGVTAGLGEEVAVRGVLQPRVGLVLANLAFTAAHAYQYSWDALLTVFLIGLALGFLRARTTTTTAAIAHGTYNFTLVLMSALTGQ